jgi:hypothetical protein
METNNDTPAAFPGRGCALMVIAAMIRGGFRSSPEGVACVLGWPVQVVREVLQEIHHGTYQEVFCNRRRRDLAGRLLVQDIGYKIRVRRGDIPPFELP